MRVYDGSSIQSDAEQAVREATVGFPPRPEMVLVFHSPRLDANAVARMVRARFPAAKIAGCTTAGELTTEGHLEGGLVIAAIEGDELRFSLRVVDLSAGFGPVSAAQEAHELAAGLGRGVDELDPRRHFCLTFIDGLSAKEESVVLAMSDAMPGVPLVGGSAGDDLAFEKTSVIANGSAFSRAAVLVLVESTVPFRVFKHQHIVGAGRYVAVTGVAEESRVLRELDGYPAAEVYARALGIEPSKFTLEDAFLHPLTFGYEDEVYVRAIRRLGPDGTLELYGSVEEGMVLDVSDHVDMASALHAQVSSDRSVEPRAAMVLVCNCVLRSLEARRSGAHGRLSAELRELGAVVIGFDSYGEQLNGLHMNQTLVGIAIGEAE